MLNESLKALIAARLDADEILDILGWENDDLVEALAEHIAEFEDEFWDAVE